MCHTKVIQFRIVKLVRIINNMYLIRFYFLIIRKCFFFLTVIFNNDDLIICISRFFDCSKTFVETFHLIFIWDDNGYQRSAQKFIFYTIESKILCFFHRSCNSKPVKVRFQCPLSGVCCIFFCSTASSRGQFMHSPVIKDFCHMFDPFCLFHAAKDKIIILRAVIITADSTDFFQKSPAHNEKMCDIVIRTQQIQIEIRFEMRIHEFCHLTVCFILIGI